MGTDALSIDTESGKEGERDLDFLPEDAIIACRRCSLSLLLHPSWVLSSWLQNYN